jgi:hypothetical protein
MLCLLYHIVAEDTDACDEIYELSARTAARIDRLTEAQNIGKAPPAISRRSNEDKSRPYRFALTSSAPSPSYNTAVMSKGEP